MLKFINPTKSLHDIAKSSEPKKIDIIFYHICSGVSVNILDSNKKLFIDYLQDWEIKKLKLLYFAWSKGKLEINKYQNEYDGFYPNGFSVNGKPLIFTVWKHDLGVDILTKILDSGVDLDHPYLRSSNPPIEYKKILASRGCIFNNLNNVQEEIDDFYDTSVWKNFDYKKILKHSDIEKAPENLLPCRLVCISDTHWEHRKLYIPLGDILICSGDLQMPWHTDLTDFIVWMGSQTQKYKILVAGNHDKLLQNNKERYLTLCKEHHIIYLEDSGVTLFGLNFWGSPWTPKRPNNKNNAFTMSRKELMSKWNKIPENVHILITHCPPYGIGDLNSDYYKGKQYQGGDFGLTKTLNRLPNLKVHIFGHQHYGRGMYKTDNGVYLANCAIAFDKSAFTF